MSAYRSAFSLNFGEPLRRLEQCHYTSCGVADYCGECKPHRWRRWWRQREQFPPVLVIGLQLVWHYVSKITQICRLKCWLKWPQIYTIFSGRCSTLVSPTFLFDECAVKWAPNVCCWTQLQESLILIYITLSLESISYSTRPALY